MKPYNKSNISLAKELRKNMTLWERKLWYEFLRFYPIRFQRQKVIGEYIADFYCAKARLIIELDGNVHALPECYERDIKRDEMLSNMNLNILRIKNVEINKDFKAVCEYIDEIVKKSLPQSASQPGLGSRLGRLKTFAAGKHRPSSEGARKQHPTIASL